jgi:glucan 1,3-beta-glucosidase
MDMLFFKAALVTGFALGAIGAHFKIPEVERTVDEILRKYKDGIDFASNESLAFNIQQRGAPSYWYENIAHQGISAFGPSGYQVFRNVKDFGAKGTLERFKCTNFFK